MTRDNHISDDMLAAYLEGNTNEEETQMVLDAIRNNPELQEIMSIAVNTEDTFCQSYSILPMLSMAAESGDNICSVMCEAYILHRRGVPFEEEDLLSLARTSHWLTPQGSPLHAIGQLLSHYGLMVTRRYYAGTEDICNALSSDNDVIAIVDCDKLYNREDKDDMPNHAVIVTSIDNDTVTIFDPQENSSISVPVNAFKTAWSTSHYYMVRVLQTVDDYEPQPITLDDIQLTEQLTELREAIAENAHEVWAAARKMEGWTYGKERDDANKEHPDLIPYSSLPDSEKNYDRIMALDTIKLVRKLGFDIVKRNK